MHNKEKAVKMTKIDEWIKTCLHKKRLKESWADYTYSSNPGYNDIDCPIITWCLAVKNK